MVALESNVVRSITIDTSADSTSVPDHLLGITSEVFDFAHSADI